MTEGFVTRIGKWIDRKWESNVKGSDLRAQDETCANRHSEAFAASQVVQDRVDIYIQDVGIALGKIQTELKILVGTRNAEHEKALSDLADIKTRIEKMEIYAGMKRVVDPMKPAVAKSAFAM